MPPETPTETFEVTEKPEAPPEPKIPSTDDLKAQGWSEAEIHSAEKHGMLKKHDPPKLDKKKDEPPAPEGKEKPDTKAESKKPDEQPEPKPDEKPEDKRGNLPDFTLTPEQEAAFAQTFGPGTNPRALYFRMKNERKARQNAEAALNEEKAKLTALEGRLQAIETGKPQQEVDEEGNVVDPEDKPLTVRQLKEMQAKAQEEIEKRRQEDSDRGRRMVEAQTEQENYAKSQFPDFDETIQLTTEIGKALRDNTIDELVPERWKQTKILNLFEDLRKAALNATKIDLDDRHAALIAYEIGQLHPTYGRKAETQPAPHGDPAEKDGKQPDPSKANGGRLTPEQMKRIEEAQRGRSSAAITGGGGSRSISAEDVDAASLNRMNYKERQRFREKYPDRYRQILRG